jgi:hypothetical protein
MYRFGFQVSMCASKWMTEMGPYTEWSDSRIGRTCREERRGEVG